MDDIIAGLIAFLTAALLGLIPAFIARKKGHSFLLWWVLGALVFILAVPSALFLKPKDQADSASTA